MKKYIILILTMFLSQSYGIQAQANSAYFENSKYSEGPINILIFRSTDSANKWMHDILMLAALDKSYQDTRKWTDGVWNYLAKPLAQIAGIPAPAMAALQQGANAFTDWIQKLDKENRVGNPEEKWRKGLPPVFTLNPGEIKTFTADELNAMRKDGRFETKPSSPFGNKELFSILAVDKDNNVQTAFYVPVDAQVLSLALKDANGKFEFGFKEKKVGGWASQWWSKLQDQVFAKYGTQQKLEQIEQANIQANRITIKQVKEFLNIQ